MGNYVLYYPLFAILLSDIELDYLASLLNIVLWFFRFIVVYMIFNFFLGIKGGATMWRTCTVPCSFFA
jgi:hypothetical protein